MAINKKTSKIQKFVSVLFVGAVFVGTVFVISIPSNLDLHLHNISFVKVFDSLIPVIIPKALQSSVLFGTHALLDRSLRVLQHLTYLSKLAAN